MDTSHGSTSSNYIYIGTGESENGFDSYYGTGILESQNNGNSWTLVTSVPAPQLSAFGLTPTVNLPGLSFSKVLVTPGSPTTVLAAATDQSANTATGLNVSGNQNFPGLVVTKNSGTNWTWLQPQAIMAGGSLPSCTDVVYDSSTSTYYAAFTGFGIYKCSSSTDPSVGSNWTAIPSPFWNGSGFGGGTITSSDFYRISLSVRSGTLYTFISNTNGVPSTPSAQDTGLYQWNGSAWSAIDVPNPTTFFGTADNQGTYDIYVAAPAGSSSLYLGGIDAWTAATVNGTSTSWTDLTNAYTSSTAHPDQHAIAFASPSNFYIGNDGGLWSNKSGTWTDGNNNLGTIQFMSVSPDPYHAAIYFGGSQDNGTELFTGTALNWQQVTGAGGDGGFTDTGSQNDYYASYPGPILFNATGTASVFSEFLTQANVGGEKSDFYFP
ncbi:MAG TPA: hypothetical protein VK859_05265, partial [bacterium]|nr:hypothetical protein [bacterium]